VTESSDTSETPAKPQDYAGLHHSPTEDSHSAFNRLAADAGRRDT